VLNDVTTEPKCHLRQQKMIQRAGILGLSLRPWPWSPRSWPWPCSRRSWPWARNQALLRDVWFFQRLSVNFLLKTINHFIMVCKPRNVIRWHEDISRINYWLQLPLQSVMLGLGLGLGFKAKTFCSWPWPWSPSPWLWPCMPCGLVNNLTSLIERLDAFH